MNKFYFATCQVGAEKAVKSEVAKAFPKLKFAFSRPGFITFKADGEDSFPNPGFIFVRLWGEVLGQAKGFSGEKPDELIQKIPDGSIRHVFARDLVLPGDEDSPDNAKKPILNWGSSWNQAPKIGNEVYDLIWIDEQHFFLGLHLHAKDLCEFPGNAPVLDLPPQAPSRAYLKLEEAIVRFKPDFKSGTKVLEVGCSPGGATFGMLNRGFRVLGVDPKRLDESIHANRNFKLIQKCAIEIRPSDIEGFDPDWLVVDMSIAPLEALDEIKHVLDVLKSCQTKPSLKYCFVTLKLNDWKFAESIPLYLKRLKELGLKNMVPQQLCSNRQEFFVFAQK